MTISKGDIIHGPGPIEGSFPAFKCGRCGGPASFRYRTTGGGDWWCADTFCNLARFMEAAE